MESSDTTFKKVRTNLQKFDPYTTTIYLAERLREQEIKSPELWGGNYPWNYLLLIRWVWEYGGQSYPSKPLTLDRLNRLMGYLYDLDTLSSARFLEKEDAKGLLQFLRITAYKQFNYQKRLGSWAFSRQSLLFGNLPSSHPIQQLVERKFGLLTSELIELLFSVWAWLSNSPGNFRFNSNALFSNMNFSQSSINAFLSEFSVEAIKLTSILANRKSSVRNPFFQITEISPFVDFPILSLGSNDYICPL